MSVYYAGQTGQIFGVEKPEYTQADDDVEMSHKDYMKGEKTHVLGRKKKKARKRIRLGTSLYKEGRWTADEHKTFVESCLVYGNNWRQVNLIKIIK
jgi:hypothetical protein